MSANESLPSSSGSGSAAPVAASTSASSSESPQSGNEQVVKFCQGFRAPERTKLTRKRAIRHTVTPSSCKKKPSCTTDPKSVTPMQRVREFSKEELTQSAGKLFCNACREENEHNRYANASSIMRAK